MNSKKINFPIERIEPGKYLFGTKSVQVNKAGERVVIRVGGGSMSLEEFCQLYGMEEIHKVMHHSPDHKHGDEEVGANPHFHH